MSLMLLKKSIDCQNNYFQMCLCCDSDGKICHGDKGCLNNWWVKASSKKER